MTASNGGTEPDAGCDVAPQEWGHDSTDSLVERVRRGIVSTWTSDEDTNKAGFRDSLAALTELAERVKAAEQKISVLTRPYRERAEAAERERDEARATALITATAEAQKMYREVEAQRDREKERADKLLAGYVKTQEQAAELLAQRDELAVVLDAAWRYYPKDTPMSESMQVVLDKVRG